MNDLTDYLKHKCLETASVELVKKTIRDDMTLSPIEKRNWISTIEAMSTAKNLVDLCNILSGRI